MHPADHLRDGDGLLAGKRIVLCVTGSIAAVETVKLARKLVRSGAMVVPVMSSSATRIIHPDSLWFACGVEPVVQLTGAVEHVSLCGEVPDRADLLLVAPCTANTMGKMACGIDDTPVTTMATTALGTGIPILIVPAMHGSMYDNPMVMENVAKLKKSGVFFVDPLMDEGKAKMASLDDINADVLRILGPGTFGGKKILVVSGPTREPVDDMRVLTNRSSGVMGVELAREAHRLGGNVLLLTTDGIIPPSGVDVDTFITSSDLFKKVDALGEYDIVLVPAAISDYAPVVVDGKIPSGKEVLSIELVGLPKLLPLLRQKARVLVAFKAESRVSRPMLEERARELLGLADVVVANDLQNVSGKESCALVVGKDWVREVEGSKTHVSRVIMGEVGHFV